MPRWVRYSRRKAPLQASGRAASVTDSRTWGTWESARRSTVGSGPGFVLAGDGIMCIDLDDCLTGGELADWAKEIVQRCSSTYIEISPSGDGLHILGYGSVNRGRRIRDLRLGNVEVYGDGRYVTVTGNRFENSPLALGDISSVLEWLGVASGQ